MPTAVNDIQERYAAYKLENPTARIRNAAADLGVSEAELLATSIGDTVTRLRSDMHAILQEIESLGHVMALSRNDEVVHERKGTYLNGNFAGHVPLFLGEDIDLRMFTGAWAHAFAVQEESRGSIRRSFQFFLADGSATHKIYLTPESNLSAYHALLSKYISEDQSSAVTVSPSSAPAQELPDARIDAAALQKDWIALQDTHDFYMLLRKHKVTRTQALRLAPDGGYAISVDNQALRSTITQAAATDLPIMAFVGNRGIIQIHTGPVKKLLDHQEWFNVMDSHFNLHIKEPAIAQSWIVRKPTVDGMVTSLELYNEKEELILTLFGKRKPGIPELSAWRELIETIEHTQSTQTR